MAYGSGCATGELRRPGGPVTEPAPDGDRVRISPSLSIPMSELRFRFTASGGPGGQHANKVATRAELRFDVTGSPSLGPRQRARLLEKLGPEVRVVADDERSQGRNRQLAVTRFRERMAAALRVETPRRPTRPTKGAKERRLTAKRHRSEKKRSRRPDLDD